MNKIIKIILILTFVYSCSLNSDSSMWSKRNIDPKEKIIKIRQITKKDEVLLKEINKDFLIKLSSLKKQNYALSYFNNNFGRTEFVGDLKNISKYKFSKINRFKEYEPEIILDGKNIIFFDNKGSILKFDKNSKLIWKKNYYNKNEKKMSPILFLSAKNNILIGLDTVAKYFAINLSTGDLIWSKYNNSPFNSEVKIFNEKFYVVDSNNVLHCFSLKNGNQLWTFKTEKPLIKSQKKNSLIIKKNMVIFNNSVGDITAVNKENGKMIWQTPTQSKKIFDESMFFKNSDLISVEDSILFSNNNNGFFSLDSNTGILNWKQKVTSNIRPVYFNDLIFTVTNEGYLVVLDKKSGNLLRSTFLFNSFKKKKRKLIKPVGLVAGKNNFYLTLNNGRLLVVDISKGNVNAVIKLDKEKLSSPIIQDQNLYITKNNSIIKLN